MSLDFELQFVLAGLRGRELHVFVAALLEE